MKKLLILLILFLAVACSTTQEAYQPKVYNLPWITWNKGISIEGKFLDDRYITRGDILIEAGKYKDALDKYYTVNQTDDRINDFNESLQLRIASGLLASDNAKLGVESLQRFYKINALSVHKVRPEASLLMAYAYGRLLNPIQSLAWFSQTIRYAEGAKIIPYAEHGAKLLLERLTEIEFARVKSKFKRDPFISPLVLFEIKRRLADNIRIYPLVDDPRFWEVDRVVATQVSSGQKLQHNVMVLLPLSGRYATFGRNIRRGIELAVADDPSFRETIYVDTQASPAVAASVCNENAATKRYSMIIGPLLFATSEAVVDCAKRHGLKLFSFTKKSAFRTNDNIYSFGVTAEIQASTLVSEVVNKLGLKNFALAYPADESSAEFARAVKSEIARVGAELAFEHTYYKNPLPDFREVAFKVDQTNPQALILVDELRAANRLSSAVGASRLNSLKLMGPAEWADESKLTQSMASLSGVIFVSPFWPEGSELGQKFSAYYKQVYGESPNFLAAQGYDIASLLKPMVAKLQSGGSWKKLSAEVQKYSGLTGQVVFSPKFGLKRKLIVIEYKNGRQMKLSRDSQPTFKYKGNNEL